MCLRTVSEKCRSGNNFSAQNREKIAADFPDLPAEWHAALIAMTRADIRELEKFGVTSRCAKYAEIPSESGAYRLLSGQCMILVIPTKPYVTPVRAQDWRTPEATDDKFAVRCGELIDLIAWDPRGPLDWALRTGDAEWLGAVPPQYCDPDRVRVRQSPLDWLRAGCAGIVPLSNDPARVYSLIMRFAEAGIYVKNEQHAIALRRLVERPWPLPDIRVEPN